MKKQVHPKRNQNMICFSNGAAHLKKWLVYQSAVASQDTFGVKKHSDLPFNLLKTSWLHATSFNIELASHKMQTVLWTNRNENALSFGDAVKQTPRQF